MNSISAHIFSFFDRLNTWFWSVRFRKDRPHGLVLMFHHVTDEYVDIDSSCKCTIDEFRKSILRLKEEGYTFVSMDDVAGFLSEFPTYKFATVTFDDVPENVLQNAVPILREHQIPYTLFIAGEFAKKEGFISESQLKELSEDPLCTIGAHTMTHPMLRKVRNSFQEMRESKKYLENLLNKSVDYLAYPFGKHSSISRKVRREAKKAGFKCAFGTIEAPINALTSQYKYYLPRTIIKNV